MKKVQDKLVFLVCLNHHQFTRLGAGVFWSGVSPRETHLTPRRAKNEIRNKQTNKQTKVLIILDLGWGTTLVPSPAAQ